MSEMTATRRAATLVVAGAVWITAAWLLWRTNVPADVVGRTAPVRASPAAVEAARDYARVARLLWLGGALAQLAAVGVLALMGPRLVRFLRGPALARSFELLAVVLVAGWAARLPFRLALHWWRRRHDLTAQSYVGAVVSTWPELIAFVAAACVALLAAVLLARRYGERWWLPAAPLLALVGALVVVLQPLVLAPRLEPLRDHRLASEIRVLARELGAGNVEVVVEQASKRTRTVDAEVAGIGPTRRVVLWDTALARTRRPELRFLVAHELAHVGRRHLWKGLAWFILLTPLVTYAAARAARRYGGMTAPAAVPAAAFALLAVQLALLPAANLVSRRYEAEADWNALVATGDSAGAERLFGRFVRDNLSDPSPPTWAYVVLATHPSLEQRTGMAVAAAQRRTAGR
jgi:STE24 endopeptidase